MKTTRAQKKEIRAMVGALNNSIVLSIATGESVPAVVENRYGNEVRTFTKTIGYIYTIEIDGEKYRGTAKGAREFITLKPVVAR